MMSASSCLWKGPALSAKQVGNVDRRLRLLLIARKRADVCYSYKGLQHWRRISCRLSNHQPWSSNVVSKGFRSDTSGRVWGSSSFLHSVTQGFQPAYLASYSAEASADVCFEGAAQEEQLENAAASSEQSLKFLSGSCYFPHPDKEKTGGEDAHFICANGQTIGVADGVGGWASIGVDAGQYARELMSNSVTTIQKEPKGSLDPASVLEKAYLVTEAMGSSTACIICLNEQCIRAVNLGDSGFIVVRDGCTVFRSPVQQHGFNCPYQLGKCDGGDIPSAAQEFTFPVAPGDVIVAGTDGLFDNLYDEEVTNIIVHAVRDGLDPQVTAQKIAALAQQQALDKYRKSPFSKAAQDAGYLYFGGKLDDITVVVSYVIASDS